MTLGEALETGAFGNHVVSSGAKAGRVRVFGHWQQKVHQVQTR